MIKTIVLATVAFTGAALELTPDNWDRENGYCSFREDPFLSPPGRVLFWLFHKNYRKIKKKLFCSNLLAPWLETFADAGDGDGGGDHLGPFWINSKITLTPCLIHFRSILGPPCAKQICFSTQNQIPKWHILTSSPLFDKDHPSP